jgi:hypothetical protein
MYSELVISKNLNAPINSHRGIKAGRNENKKDYNGFK